MYITSVCSSDIVDSEDIHVLLILKTYTSQMPLTTFIIMFYQSRNFLSNQFSPHPSVRGFCLLKCMNDHCFQNFFDRSSRASKAIGCYQFQHLMPPVIPSTSQGLHILPHLIQGSCQLVAGPRYLPGLSVCLLPCPQSGPSWTPRFSMQMWG